jgi:hypothetical protein
MHPTFVIVFGFSSFPHELVYMVTQLVFMTFLKFELKGRPPFFLPWPIKAHIFHVDQLATQKTSNHAQV